MPATGSRTSSGADSSPTESSTAAASWMSTPPTWLASLSATSSLESESGRTHFAEQVGQMIGRYGLAHVLASLSPRQAKAAGLMMSDISGPLGTTSSTSATLQSCLANRLRAKTASVGSTLFSLTWKFRVTPLGRQIYALRASALRTSDNGFGSWPTATTRDWKDGHEQAVPINALLGRVAWLAGWPTTKVADGRGNPYEATENRRSELRKTVALAGWPTPTKANAEGGQIANCSPTGRRPDGSKATVSINQIAKLAGWPTTTTTQDSAGSRAYGYKGQAFMTLTDAAFSADSGPALTGSPVATASGGQLNPSHSRWLMGIPPAWDECAPIIPRRLKRK